MVDPANPYRLCAVVRGRLQHQPWKVSGPEAAEEHLERLRSSGEWPEGAQAMLMGPRPEVLLWTRQGDRWVEVANA